MIVLTVDVMMLLTVAHVGWSILRVRNEGPPAVMVLSVLTAALLWGAAWSWIPALAALRFLPAPQGQAGAIFGLIVAFNLLRLVPSVKAMFRSIDMKLLVDLSVWRLLYGAALLVIGLLGGLPAAFFGRRPLVILR